MRKELHRRDVGDAAIKIRALSARSISSSVLSRVSVVNQKSR